MLSLGIVVEAKESRLLSHCFIRCSGVEVGMCALVVLLYGVQGRRGMYHHYLISQG